MSNLTRAVAAAVFAVAVGAAGLYLLPRDGGVGGPGPSTLPTPTITPDPSLTEHTLRSGSSSSFEVRLRAPATWTGEFGSFVIQKDGGQPPRGMAIAVWVVENVYADGCRWSGNLIDPPVGPTVDDLANALAGLEDREVTAPIDVTVDGYSGKQLEMTIPDIDFAQCDGAEFRSWVDPQGSPRFHQGPGEHSRILILNVDGTRVLVFGRSFPATSPADRAELDAILASMQIDALSEPSTSP